MEQEYLPTRFEIVKDYWKTAIDEGRAQRIPFYQEVFESPQTEIYQEMANEEMILLISKTMNSTWVGRETIGRMDAFNGALPASSSSTTTSSSGESSPTKA